MMKSLVLNPTTGIVGFAVLCILLLVFFRWVNYKRLSAEILEVMESAGDEHLSPGEIKRQITDMRLKRIYRTTNVSDAARKRHEASIHDVVDALKRLARRKVLRERTSGYDANERQSYQRPQAA